MNQTLGDQSSLGEQAGRRELSTRRRRPLRFAAVAVAGAVLAGFVVGFIGYTDSVIDPAPPPDPRAEGIVVLTGGTARIDGALALLAEGRAERLLISGVNPVVTLEMLAETIPVEARPVLLCCVDIDYARDTIENASETHRWMDERGFKSLIVVTSDYHMPRAFAELGAAMPEVRLIAYPVSNPDLRLADWWRDPQIFALLVREYGKFLVAETRQLLSTTRMARAADL